jgi:integrase
MLREGRDPATERGAERAKEKAKRATALTFKQVAEQFYKDKSPEWKNPVHRGQWKATLEKYAYPKIGSLLIGDIDQAAVLRVLKPIWETRTVTAVRVCGRIEKVIGYAIVSGLRSGENPARWNGHLETLLPKPGTTPPSPTPRLQRSSPTCEREKASPNARLSS